MVGGTTNDYRRNRLLKGSHLMSESNTSALEAEELVMDHRAESDVPTERSMHVMRREICERRLAQPPSACAAANEASPISSDLSDRYPKNPAFFAGFFCAGMSESLCGWYIFRVRHIEWRKLNVPDRCRRGCAGFQPPEPGWKDGEERRFRRALCPSLVVSQSRYTRLNHRRQRVPWSNPRLRRP